jgi:ATP-dependent DNA helicase Rep
LSVLNPQQHAAVHHLDSPLLVLAGAGSGKTSVIARKIAALVQRHGFAPAGIAAVTFTNKAAREMKIRVAGLLDREQAQAVAISTFHTLGLRILRANLKALGYRAGFSLYDAEDSRGLVAKLMAASTSGKRDLLDDVRNRISRWKNDLVAPAQAAEQAESSGEKHERIAAKVYADYEDQLRASNAFDFDDLILKPVQLLRDHADILGHWRAGIGYLLVDEYQDTNLCQYELVKLLMGGRPALTVVGDDDQSIYAWRGARPENLAQLPRDFPDLKVIKLEQNYRSTGRILKAANALIGHNPHVFEKRLWSKHAHGEPLRVLGARNEEHEAERAVNEITYHRLRHGTGFGDYAILFRENHQARALERVLRERRIPYVLSGAQSFFDRTEVKDIMAYLRLVANVDDDSAFLRIINTPRREIGASTLAALNEYAGAHGLSLFRAACHPGLASRLNPRQMAMLRRFTVWLEILSEKAQHDEPGKVVKELLADIRYEDWLKDICDDTPTANRRLENVSELVSWLRRLAKQDDETATLGELVARLSLLGMLEKEGDDLSGDQVALMTVHAAKGLEFDHVHVVGMEEGLLPHRSCLEKREDAARASEKKAKKEVQEPPPAEAVEEERRLAYVAITRACKTLTFSFAEKRRRGGEILACEPSRFLSELPPEDLHWETPRPEPDPNAVTDRAETYLANLRSLLGKPKPEAG